MYFVHMFTHAHSVVSWAHRRLFTCCYISVFYKNETIWLDMLVSVLVLPASPPCYLLCVHHN